MTSEGFTSKDDMLGYSSVLTIVVRLAPLQGEWKPFEGRLHKQKGNLSPSQGPHYY